MAITTSQHPRMAALPAKQRPLVMPDERDETREPAEEVEREAVEPGHPDAVGVAGPSAAALGEEHDRQPLALGHLEQPVLLPVVLQALGAGEDRVVVGHHHDGLARRRCPCHRPARRRGALDEVLQLAPPALGGDHQRAVLDEAAGVEEVVDVLAGRALAGAAAALHRVGPGGVEPDLVAGPHLGEVGPLAGRDLGGDG